MTRVRSLLVLVVALAMVAAFVSEAQGQDAQRSRRRGGGMSRDSLIGLLAIEPVQRELQLTDDKLADVKKISDELTAEIRKQYTALRDIEDRDKRLAKMTELRDQFDRKSREKLRDVLAREQMMRLYQIRMQVRLVTESLASRYVAERLKLTDEQKKKLAQTDKDMQAKRTELFRDMRNASQEDRAKAYEKYRKLRTDADRAALAVLTDEQKKAFEEMPTRSGRRQPARKTE